MKFMVLNCERDIERRMVSSSGKTCLEFLLQLKISAVVTFRIAAYAEVWPFATISFFSFVILCLVKSLFSGLVVHTYNNLLCSCGS